MMYSLRCPRQGDSYIVDNGGSDDESGVDPPRDLDPDGARATLFFEPELVPTKPVDGVLQDHPKMDLDMITGLILLMVKVDPKTTVSVLIAMICSQFKYTPSYCKTWIAMQNALDKMHTVAQDGDGRILLIAFALTPRESCDNCDFFLSSLRRHVYPQPDICFISNRGARILAAIKRQRSIWDCTHVN
ncbi:hypothetical protein PVK06_039438 [Gossypium arboreum]|uniref:Uncharacterized protein n=1 Tax=Gossypium arboreum TaxID=29729 RepID=A0ABR0N2U9_GOSAR|nr:hypothetical protein PVK06_039438 [Gossypium arboreum]